LGDVDKGDDMYSELAKYRADDVGIEDIVLWSFLRKLFHGLKLR